MAMARAGDLNIEYYAEGEGPPLLMIRGLGGQASTWGEPFLSRLRQRFTTIRFSNRGTGLSDKLPAATSIREMADDAASLLSELGFQRAHVFGISMGGMIAQELVLNHPERVQGLVLGCTNCGQAHGVPVPAENVARLRELATLSGEERARKYLEVTITPEFALNGKDFLNDIMQIDQRTPTPAETYAKQMAAAQTFDSYDRLPQITAPTLIIHGDRDQLLAPENAQILASRIPGAEVRIVSNAAHMFFWEKPEESASAIADFLSRVPLPA